MPFVADAQVKQRNLPRPFHFPKHHDLPHPGHFPKRSDAYLLSNRWFLKWTPSALVPFNESFFRIGAEYCFARGFGIGLEGGPLLRSGSEIASDEHLTGGYYLNADARVYMGFHRTGRGFIGLQGYYRDVSYSSGRITIIRRGDLYQGYQSGAQKSVGGLGIQGGFVLRITGPLHLEADAGMGGKYITLTRDNITALRNLGSDHYSYGFEEHNIDGSAWMAYFLFDVKLSLLLGRRWAGQAAQDF